MCCACAPRPPCRTGRRPAPGLRRQPRAPVGDLQRHPVAAGRGQGDRDRRRAVPQRVAHQVRHDHVDAPPVDHGPYVLPEFDGHPVGPPPQRQRRPYGVGEVRHGRVEADRPGVEAGDLHQVLDQPGQPRRLRADGTGRVGGVRRQLVGVLLQDRRHHRHRRQGRAQFVRHVRHEPPRLRLLGPQLRVGRLERVGRLVERPRQVGQFVVATDRHPAAEVPCGEFTGGPPQLPYRPQDRPGGQQRQQRGQHHHGHGPRPYGVQQGGRVVALGPQVGDHEDLQARGAPVPVGVRHGRADDQIRVAAPLDPLEPGPVPGPDSRPQFGGDPALRVGVRVGDGGQVLVAGDHDARAQPLGDLRREPGQRPLVGRQVEPRADDGDPLPEVVHGGVLGALEDGGAGVPVGEGRRGHRADEGDEDEGHDEPDPQPAGEPPRATPEGAPQRAPGPVPGGAPGDGPSHSGPKR